MKLMASKQGKLGTSVLNTAILAIILLVVLFELYANLVPTAQTAGNTLCNSGVPLGGLFNSTGVVFVIIMAALLILVVTAFIPKGKK